MNHKLESKLPGKISITLDILMNYPYDRKQRGTKEPLDEGERSEKAGLKVNIQRMKTMASGPITS